MILNFNTLASQIELINNCFNEVGQIQKIYSSSTTIDIAIRFPGNTKHLYLGRGAGVEGIWLSENRIPSELRKIDKFLEYLRRYLSGCTYQHLSIDSLDRCIAINYGRMGKMCAFMLFYAGRDLYFANYFYDEKKDRMQLFKSWENKTTDFDGKDQFSVFNEVGRIDLEKNHLIQDSGFIEFALDKEFERIKSLNSNKKQTKFLNRKLEKIELDLERLKKSDDLLKLADTEEDFSKLPRKTKLFGIRFNFEGNTHFQRRNEIFQKAKRLRKNQALLYERLEETKKLLENKKNPIKEINPLKCVSPVWKLNKEKNNTQVEKNSLDYKVITIDNVEYAIGTTAFGNDQMRKLWSKKEDLWFHFENGVSPHVIVKLKGKNLDEGILQNIAKIMKDATNLHFSEIDLIYTQVKNLKGVKGTKGKVIFKKEKHIRVRL